MKTQRLGAISYEELFQFDFKDEREIQNCPPKTGLWRFPRWYHEEIGSSIRELVTETD